MPITRDIKKYIYRPSMPLKKVLHDLYRKQVDICLVAERDQKILGVLTLGDIKQAILRGIDPHAPIQDAMNSNFVSAPSTSSEKILKKLAHKKNKYGTGGIEKIPLVDSKGNLRGLYIDAASLQNPKQKTVLVTGGAGYVGSIVCRKLLDKGYKVIAFDYLRFGKNSITPLLKNPSFRLVEGTLSNIAHVLEGVKHADAVIHLAGVVGDPASSVDPIQTLESNHFSTKILIELCKYYQVSRFVFASSCSVYGANKKVLNEKSSLRPLSLYSRTKISAEQDLQAAHDNYFHPVILRFGTLYGISPRMRFDLAVNVMTAKAFFHKKILVDGGTQWRPFVHVADAAQACVLALEAPTSKVAGEIFNVGSSDQNYQISGIARTIQDMVPQASIVEKNTSHDGRDYKVSFAKIENTLGFQKTIDLATGIQEIITALKQGQYDNFKDPKFSNYLTHLT